MRKDTSKRKTPQRPSFLRVGADVEVELEGEGWVLGTVKGLEGSSVAVDLDDDEADAQWSDVREWSADSRWRLIELRNLTPSDELSLETVVVFEALDSPKRILPHLWCAGLAVTHRWVAVPLVREGVRLRLNFPTTLFERMPSRLFLEWPRQDSIGSRWRLLGEDEKQVLAVMAMKSGVSFPGREVRQIVRFYRTGRRTPPRSPRQGRH